MEDKRKGNQRFCNCKTMRYRWKLCRLHFKRQRRLSESILYADEETKENRIQEIYGEAGLKLKNRVKDMDVRRGLNYKYFTGQDWGKAQNYDLALNRGSLGIEKCAQLIVDAASEE